jgi:hypothetical protein
MKKRLCIKDRFHKKHGSEKQRIIKSDDPCWNGDETKFTEWCMQHGACPSEIWEEVVEEHSIEFYKKFYEENYATVQIHENLRKHFSNMVEIILGKDYYNLSMDVYVSDQECCQDIIEKSRKWWWPKKKGKK